MKNICLLGASGSIGTQTVDVISRYPKLFNLVAVSANSSVKKIIDIIYNLKIFNINFYFSFIINGTTYLN